eukprot:TRINITY_DN12600_c0_g1_i2.p1 TRINITY_DN12600_c0_g1~~TRINITY_DN12600_c0_g1_i2.p1  ORF type:complete len:139 (+),score=16.39 TRINITY_DN12600_c0_g1_i2:86-502(+)
MVKTFSLTRDFSVSIEDFFDNTLGSCKFEEECHLNRGNQRVTVTEWLTSQSNSLERVCFFLLVDKGNSGIGECSCLETQKFSWEELEGKKRGRMLSSIVPDNPSIGNVFRIESVWNLISEGTNCYLSAKKYMGSNWSC